MKKENRTRAITVLLVGICAVAVTAFAAQRIVNLTCDKALMGDVSIKTLRTGGDPLNGTDSTEVTATAAELNYLDVTAGTATASKALVLNSSKTVASVNSMSVTGTLTIAEGGLANSTVVSADIKDATIVAADIQTNVITAAKFAAADWGDVTVAYGGAVSVDDNAVLASEIGAGTFPTDVVFSNQTATGNIYCNELHTDNNTVLAGDMQFNDTIRLTPTTIGAITNNAVLLSTLARATYTYEPAYPATTNTVANPVSGGDWVCLINVGTNTMTLAKAANLALGSATRVLGQYDILVLRAATAAVWVEESFTDNTLAP